MKFHGRLGPGVVTDDSQVITLYLHEPRKASAITLKIWELDTYVDADGAAQREGKQPELLAELAGDLAPGPSATDPRLFTTSSVKIATEDKDGNLLTLRLAVSGSDTVHAIPLPSEKDEAEGRTYEIGFSIEQGGAEVFRCKAPCLFYPKHVFPTAVAATYRQLSDEQCVYQEPLRLRHAVVGVMEDDKLTVLASGYVDLHGHLVDAAPEDGKPPPQPLPLRQGRELFVYATREPTNLAPGPSKIPIALCDPIGADGTIVHRIAGAPHPWAFRILEQSSTVGTGDTSFSEPEAREPSPLGEGELDRAFREMDAFLRERLDSNRSDEGEE